MKLKNDVNMLPATEYVCVVKVGKHFFSMTSSIDF